MEKPRSPFYTVIEELKSSFPLLVLQWVNILCVFFFFLSFKYPYQVNFTKGAKLCAYFFNFTKKRIHKK